MRCGVNNIINYWCCRNTDRLLPSSFLGRRGRSQPAPVSKKAKKISTYDRDIVCLPYLFPSKDGRYAIPRKESRAELGSKGLIGKIRLTSDMLEQEIMAEIRSVFSVAMRDDPEFPFTFMQRSGPGSTVDAR